MQGIAVTLVALWALGPGAAAGRATPDGRQLVVTIKDGIRTLADGSVRLVSPSAVDPARLPARGSIVVEAQPGTTLAAALERLAESGERVDRMEIRAEESARDATAPSVSEMVVTKVSDSASTNLFEVHYQAFAAPVEPIPGGRPDPGGPDQGFGVATVLPNLVIGAAKPQPGSMAMVQAQVVNTGAGPSAATEVKLFYHRGGQVETAASPVPPLAAGQQAIVPLGVNLPLGAADSVTLRVDDPNVISETNELDNGFIVK
jgi:hypothetical protein